MSIHYTIDLAGTAVAIGSSRLVYRAACLAIDAHAGQRRKYTGEPYVLHPLAVSSLVASTGARDEAVAAAVLHDVLEDTAVTLADLELEFGQVVAGLVAEVTDVSRPEDGNREVRKALDRQHLAAASPGAKTIKLADLVDNAASITEHAPDFARVFMREKALLLPVLLEGDPLLWARADAIVRAYDIREGRA